MEYFTNYFNPKRDYYNALIEYLESQGDDSTRKFEKFKDIINQGNFDSKEEKKILLRTIKKVIKYRHGDNLSSQISQILTFLFDEKEFNKVFTNAELFKILKMNQRILVYLFSKGLVDPDSFQAYLKQKRKVNVEYYYRLVFYFHEELEKMSEKSNLYLGKSKIALIKNSFSGKDADIFKDYEKRREIGENHNEICQIIRRNSSYDEFKEYLENHNITIDKKNPLMIPESPYDTNPYFQNGGTLFEYAIYYGANNIVKYFMDIYKEEFNFRSLAISIFSYNNKFINNCINRDDIKKFFANDKNFLNEFVINTIKSHCKRIDLLEDKKESLMKSNSGKFENYPFWIFKHYNFELISDYFNDNNNVLDDLNLSRSLFSYFCSCDFLDPVQFLVKNVQGINNNKNDISIK